MKHKMPEVGEIALAWASQQEDLYEFKLSRVDDDGRDIKVQLAFRDGDQIDRWSHIFTASAWNSLRVMEKYHAVRRTLDLMASECRVHLSRAKSGGMVEKV